jgi:hypothetical protein
MMIFFMAAGAFSAWILPARYLFRRWVKNDTLTAWDKECSHGYSVVDKGEPCHGRHPCHHLAVALAAAGAALILPVTLSFMFIMGNPPKGRRELDESIRALTGENERLRREQDAR